MCHRLKKLTPQASDVIVQLQVEHNSGAKFARLYNFHDIVQQLREFFAKHGFPTLEHKKARAKFDEDSSTHFKLLEKAQPKVTKESYRVRAAATLRLSRGHRAAVH